MKWFGEHWGAPVCDDNPHVPTPVGEPCLDCLVRIKADDDGFLVPALLKPVDQPESTIVLTTPPPPGLPELPYHHDCFMELILGPGWREFVRAAGAAMRARMN